MQYSGFNYGIAVGDEIIELTISIEAIEHLENPFQFIRELGRGTKPNGIIFITTPNVYAIRSPVNCLFCGMPTLFEYVHDDHMGQHITPVSIGQFLYGFKMAGLQLIGVFSTGPKSSLLVTCILFLLNSLTSIGIRLIKAKRKSDLDYFPNVLSTQQLVELNRDVSLIFVAQKRNE